MERVSAAVQIKDRHIYENLITTLPLISAPAAFPPLSLLSAYHNHNFTPCSIPREITEINLSSDVGKVSTRMSELHYGTYIA